MSDDDAALLGGLRDMWTTYDPPPADLVTRMIAAVAAAEIDDEWEMLVLVRDSAEEALAQVRGLATSRMLSFSAAEGWTLEVELDEGQVRGQLLDLAGDPTGTEVLVETSEGQTWSTVLDEVGFFALDAEPTGSVRFTVRREGRSASSSWIEV